MNYVVRRFEEEYEMEMKLEECLLMCLIFVIVSSNSKGKTSENLCPLESQTINFYSRSKLVVLVLGQDISNSSSPILENYCENPNEGLIKAAEDGNRVRVEILLDCPDVDINHYSLNNETALHIASPGKCRNGQTPLEKPTNRRKQGRGNPVT